MSHYCLKFGLFSILLTEIKWKKWVNANSFVFWMCCIGLVQSNQVVGFYITSSNKHDQVPKQGSMLQVSIPTLSPLQGRPPDDGGGLVPERNLRLTPTSHVRLHALHWVQLLHPQSTGTHTMETKRDRTRQTGQEKEIKKGGILNTQSQTVY